MSEVTLLQYLYVDYVLGTKFEQRVYDAYIGVNSLKRPPFLEDIFIEIMGMEALIALDEKLCHVMEQSEWDHMYKEVVERNEDTQIQVLEAAYGSQYPMILSDVYKYLSTNRMSFLTREDEYGTVSKAVINYAPVVSVW
ncbi:hypothetical protein ACQKJG_18835 [Priestia megaterium]|uniref:hypothetical protein n=1 Tax=Priestia megaterium TaxID=1404 RepID=UPI003D08DCFE